MKKIYLLSLLFLFSLSLIAQEPFITTWKTTTDKESITIPTNGEGYNYSVDWGDGSSDSELTGDATHEYDTAGIYTVSISGDFPRIYFHLSEDKEKILSIEQWGDIQWKSMSAAFNGCENLTCNAVDAPELSEVTDMSMIFANAIKFDGDLSQWDVSNITNMFAMFDRAFEFKGDLSLWNVSKVTNMSFMFSAAFAFNADLSNWDVSNVTDMSGMFSVARSFNGDISQWDVSNVTDMSNMFSTTNHFNGDISSWEVSNVTNMESIFANAILFNRDLSSWDVSNVNTMSRMFDGAAMSLQNYDKTLNGWASLDSLQEDVELGGEGLYYCEGETGRNTLINDFGWTLNDEGMNCRFQRIVFGLLDMKTFGDEDFAVDAYATSDLPVNYFSSNQDVASIDDNVVTIIGAGVVNIGAIQEGNENYDAADTITRELTIFKANQVITFDSIPAKAYWSTDFSLKANASSELPISYTSSNQDVAEIVSDSLVDLKSIGTTSITAYQQGNSNYHPAESVPRELVVLRNTVTAVKDIENSTIEIFPNPTQNVLHIQNLESVKKVNVYNAAGKLIGVYEVLGNRHKIDLKNQANGIYYIQLDTKDEVFKILKN